MERVSIPLKLIFTFIVGFLIGCFVVLSPFIFASGNKRWSIAIKSGDILSTIQSADQSESALFDDSLAQKLFNEVKILCMVMTFPARHNETAIHVQNTWGRRCNRLMFITSKEDSILDDSLVLNLNESRGILWNKTKSAFFHAHDELIDDYDFFLKADDDNYIIMENMRYLLYQYDPEVSLYFGHRYKVKELEKGYMAGGGYILSRQAVKNFVKVARNDPEDCIPDEYNEDWEMGHCMTKHAIFLHDRDEKNQKRFFPISIPEHLVAPDKVNHDWWYRQRMYFEVAQGDLNCCSDTAIAFHYISPVLMYELEYFIYKVHPFGLKIEEKLPEKISLKELE